ncbi:MAG TPA: hypothetical protein DER23_02455 [Clostridiales bacterium]|nr:hypothetical protein [Clostridiales bacterium]
MSHTYVIPENILVEPKRYRNGIPDDVDSHIQQHMGPAVAALAHIHDLIELLYCLDGSFKAFLNGIEYRLEKGCLLLIKSQEIHHIFAESAELNRYIVLKIDPRFLCIPIQSSFESKFALPFTMNGKGGKRLYAAQEVNEAKLGWLIHELHHELTWRTYGYELAVRAHISRLFLWILRYWEANGVSLGCEVSDHLRTALSRCINNINEKYKENLTARDMADRFNISYSYFSRMFKRLTGRSFCQYLNSIRIAEAEKLLVTTDMTITAIAMETGFCDTCHLIVKFKEEKGTTPMGFRKTYAQDNQVNRFLDAE